MKKIYILSVYFVAVVFYVNNLVAQDPHFSQYFASPMTLNPALTGMGVSDWRVSGVHRAQWWGAYVPPFTTTSVSIEKNVLVGREHKNKLGLGLSMVNDASNSGLLKNNYFSFSGAYHVAFNEDASTVLSGGIMATYANRLMDASKFAFQDQYGSMGFQRSIPSADPVSVFSNNYWDVHAGLHFRKEFMKWGYDAGIALYHASRPSEGAYNNLSYSLNSRVSMQAGAFFSFANDNRLYARIISEIQGTNAVHTVGGIYSMALSDETIKSFDLGLYHRFGDATYPYAGVSGKTWQAGLSYDFVNSGIKTVYNSVQSIELSFICQFRGKKNTAPVKSSYVGPF